MQAEGCSLSHQAVRPLDPPSERLSRRGQLRHQEYKGCIWHTSVTKAGATGCRARQRLTVPHSVPARAVPALVHHGGVLSTVFVHLMLRLVPCVACFALGGSFGFACLVREIAGPQSPESPSQESGKALAGTRCGTIRCCLAQPSVTFCKGIMSCLAAERLSLTPGTSIPRCFTHLADFLGALNRRTQHCNQTLPTAWRCGLSLHVYRARIGSHTIPIALTPDSRPSSYQAYRTLISIQRPHVDTVSCALVISLLIITGHTFTSKVMSEDVRSSR